MSGRGCAALVTGAANKLAVAFAEALAAEGYAVMLNDPDRDCRSSCAQSSMRRRPTVRAPNSAISFEPRSVLAWTHSRTSVETSTSSASRISPIRSPSARASGSTIRKPPPPLSTKNRADFVEPSGL